MRKHLLKKFTINVLLVTLACGGQERSISVGDWSSTGLSLGLAAGLELYGKDRLVSEYPRFKDPNAFDRIMREKLWLGEVRQEQARVWSDILIYGVSMSSILWGPLMTDNPEHALLINARVFSANSILTNLIKIMSARERPYHHYQTRDPEGSKDFTSFYSGHSSVAFSQAVTNGVLLSHSIPQHEVFMWTSLLGLASTTAYLRVAGDMHYFSDILIGALSGSMVAWVITQSEVKRLNLDASGGGGFRKGNRGEDFLLTIKIPLG